MSAETYLNSRGEAVPALSPGFAVNMMANALWRLSSNQNLGPYTAMAMYNTAARLEAMVDLLVSGKNKHMKTAKIAMNRDSADRLINLSVRNHGTSSQIVGRVDLERDSTPIGEVVRSAVYLGRVAEDMGLLTDEEMNALDTTTDMAALNWSEPFFKLRVSQIPVPTLDGLIIPPSPAAQSPRAPEDAEEMTIDMM